MSFDVVAAIDDALGLGRAGQVPWHLPGDLAHFVAITRRTESGRPNAVIMGRKTWESIPDRFRPLGGRFNIVVTRRADHAVPEGVAVAPDLSRAVEIGRDRSDRLFVIGGGEIYREALARVDCRDLFLTRVRGRFDCDVFFPPFEDRFERTEVLDEAVEGGISYRIERWIRKTV